MTRLPSPGVVFGGVSVVISALTHVSLIDRCLSVVGGLVPAY